MAAFRYLLSVLNIYTSLSHVLEIFGSDNEYLNADYLDKETAKREKK